MELAEIGRCRASVSPPQTHQGGQLGSILAVAVCWGCPRRSTMTANDRADPKKGRGVRRHGRRECSLVSTTGTTRPAPPQGPPATIAVIHPLAHSDTSASVCGSQRTSERAESERAHSDTSASVCGSQRASERAESERASKRGLKLMTTVT